MNVNMWQHPAVRANLDVLRERGVRVIDPGTGDLGWGMVGEGRMAEPEAIAEVVFNSLGRRNDLAGETLLITAGGTREPIDPVRFIGNRSSGKMGYALADAAQSRGARVILVSGPTALHPPSTLHEVVGRDHCRRDAQSGARTHGRGHHGDQGGRSVADYRPVNASGAEAEAHWSHDPGTRSDPEDILAEVLTRQRRPGQLIRGLCGGDRKHDGERTRQAAAKGR